MPVIELMMCVFTLSSLFVCLCVWAELSVKDTSLPYKSAEFVKGLLKQGVATLVKGNVKAAFKSSSQSSSSSVTMMVVPLPDDYKHEGKVSLSPLVALGPLLHTNRIPDLVVELILPLKTSPGRESFGVDQPHTVRWKARMAPTAQQLVRRWERSCCRVVEGLLQIPSTLASTECGPECHQRVSLLLSTRKNASRTNPL